MVVVAAAADPEAIALPHNLPAELAQHHAHANVHNNEGAVNAARAYWALDENAQMNDHEAGPVVEDAARDPASYGDWAPDEAISDMGNTTVGGIQSVSTHTKIVQQETNLTRGPNESTGSAIGAIDAPLSNAFVVPADEGYASDDADDDGLEITSVNGDPGNEWIDTADILTGGLQVDEDGTRN